MRNLVLGKMLVKMFVGSFQIVSRLDNQSKYQMFTLPGLVPLQRNFMLY